MPTHSCAFCERLIFDFPRGSIRIEVERPQKVPVSKEQVKELELSISQVEDGHNSGCSFATWIWPRLGSEQEYRKFGSSKTLCCSFNSSTSLMRVLLDGFSSSHIVKGFDLITEQEDIAAEWEIAGAIKLSPRGDGTHNLARKWFQQCVTEHQHDFTLPDSAPSRLVEITIREGKMVSLKLITEVAQSVKYVALSYCWGGDQQQKLTRRNFSDYQQTIALYELSQTVQDAIEVTMTLGYNHIWIDCLCIIQDDDADKIIEVARMPSIYSRAVVTIAATSASGAKHGFLGPRKDAHPDAAVNLRFRDREGKIGQATALHKFPLEDSEPLNERGWALQERVLSTRLLDYSTRQLRFTCPFTDKTPLVDGWLLRNSDILTKSYTMQKLPTFHDLREGKLEWNQIIRDYTSRELTLLSDRPLAISAIAQQFESLFPERYSTYIAGLWESEFPNNLLWTHGGLVHAPRRRDDLFPSPTWSWITTDIAVNTKRKLPINRLCIEIVSHKVTLEDKDAAYGRCTEAVLRVKGRLLQAWCVRHLKDKRDEIAIMDDKYVTIMSRPLWDAPAVDFPRDESRWRVQLLLFGSVNVKSIDSTSHDQDSHDPGSSINYPEDYPAADLGEPPSASNEQITSSAEAEHTAKGSGYIESCDYDISASVGHNECFVGLVLREEQTTTTIRRFSRLGGWEWHSGTSDEEWSTGHARYRRQKMAMFRDCEAETIELI